MSYFKLLNIFNTHLEFASLGVHRKLVKVHWAHEPNPCGDYI